MNRERQKERRGRSSEVRFRCADGIGMDNSSGEAQSALPSPPDHRCHWKERRQLLLVNYNYCSLLLFHCTSTCKEPIKTCPEPGRAHSPPRPLFIIKLSVRKKT